MKVFLLPLIAAIFASGAFAAEKYSCFKSAESFPEGYEEVAESFYFGDGLVGADTGFRHFFQESVRIQTELGYCGSESVWIGDGKTSTSGCWGVRLRPEADAEQEVKLDIEKIVELWKVGNSILTPNVVVRDLLNDPEKILARIPLCVSRKI